MKEISYFCNIFNRRIMGEKSLDVRMAQSVAPSSPTTSYNNSIPKLGEIIFNNTLNNFKVGNGNTAYGSLANFLGKTITNVSRNTSVTPNTTVITYSDNTTSVIPDGADGQDGTSVRIQPNAESCVAIGDGYIDTDGNLQVLTSLDPRTFTLAGQIRGPEGPQGATGNGISSISYFYTTTSSQTTPTAEDITSTTIPVLDSDEHKYLWQKEVVNYTDETSQTNISLICVYGDTGAQGAAGTNGSDGTTPHIDATTGNWFIGSTDTEIHAQGPQGETGPQGPQGESGLMAQADWAETDSSADSYIQNKPTRSEFGFNVYKFTGTPDSNNQLKLNFPTLQRAINNLGTDFTFGLYSTITISTLNGFKISFDNGSTSYNVQLVDVYAGQLDWPWDTHQTMYLRVNSLATGSSDGTLHIIGMENSYLPCIYANMYKQSPFRNSALGTETLKMISSTNTSNGRIGLGWHSSKDTLEVIYKPENYKDTTNGRAVAVIKPQRDKTIGANDNISREVAFVDEIPTNTSDLTNDSGFLTEHQSIKTINNESLIGTGNLTISVPTKTSDLTNDSNFTTQQYVQDYVAQHSGGTDAEAVHFTQQTLTTTQQEQARTNIGVGNGTLTIQQNGTTKGTFSANQSESTIVNIEVPNTFETWTFYGTSNTPIAVKSVCVNSSTT